MKQEVTIDENEVNQAILDYAEKHGVKLENVATKVTVVAGRGDRGVYATIAIEPSNVLLVTVNPTSTTKPVFAQTIQEVFENIEEDEGVPVEVEDEIDDDTVAFG